MKFHYSAATIDGTELDSSYKVGVPQTGLLGSGKVMPCIENALGRMRIGSKATLICPQEKVVGEPLPDTVF